MTTKGNTTASNGYVYDFENHLIQASRNTYAYDVDGIRVQKIVAGFRDEFAGGYAESDRLPASADGELFL
jgi:hypothetical protein